MIERYEKQQMDLYKEMTRKPGIYKGKCPPAPVLIRFHGNNAILRVQDFQPTNGQKAFWYAVHARVVTGKDLKARLNDRALIGTGVFILNRPGVRFTIGGLQPYQNYVFALAAYTEDGKLIGDSIGASTHPMAFTPSFSVIIARLQLAQKAFLCGCYNSSYCAGIISLFYAEREQQYKECQVQELKTTSRITSQQLNIRLLRLQSPVAIRYLMTSLFIETSEQTALNKLFCTRLVDPHRAINVQTARIQHSASLLLLIDLAKWCNDQSYVLQAVTTIYGLLVPLLFHKIHTDDILMLLRRCLQALNGVEHLIIKQKKQMVSIQHMIAVITFHSARILRQRGDRSAANQALEQGRVLLKVDKNTKKIQQMGPNQDADEHNFLREEAQSTLSLIDLKKRYAAEIDATANSVTGVGDDEGNEQFLKTGSVAGGDLAGDTKSVIETGSSSTGPNVNLKAIETQLARNARKATDRMMELSGHEDPMILVPIFKFNFLFFLY